MLLQVALFHYFLWLSKVSLCICTTSSLSIHLSVGIYVHSGDGQGSLVCCSPWGRKESDTTERLNWYPFWTNVILVFFFFFPPLQKAFLFSLVQGLGEGSGWLKSCLVAAERGFRQKLWHQRGPSKTTRLRRLLVVLAGEPLEESPAQPCLGTSQPAEVGQVVAHLPDEFHLLT